MSKYIKVLDTVEEYNNYSGGTGFVTPNISYVKGNDKSYYDNNEIKHYTPESWIVVNNVTGTTFNKIVSYITKVTIPDNITKIDGEAFIGCCFTSIDIPSGVTIIGISAFRDCTSLTSLNIPNGVTSIGSNAFQGCSSLTSINIPSGITSINHYVFKECSFTSIDIPSGVTSIGAYSFHYCSSLTSIDIPSGVTSIENNCFLGCSSLTSIIVNAINPPTLGSGVFSDTNNCPIYVPSQSVETYKAATNWSGYTSRIQAIPNN